MAAVTISEVLDILNVRLGRPSTVLDEVLAILAENGPGLFDAFGIPAPRTYALAGEALSADHFPMLVVSASTESPPMGMGHADQDHVMIIYAVNPQAAHRQIKASLDAVTMLRGLFYHPSVRKRVHENDDQTKTTIWQSCVPIRITPVPGDFASYTGFILHLQIDQVVNNNSWAEVALEVVLSDPGP
jgi:hypothetical protein